MSNDSNKIPCDNCITLPICRTENKDLDIQTFWISYETLNKCSIVKSFGIKADMYTIRKLTTLLTGKEYDYPM